jgi:4-carboxymuconolactone decarboxylase
VTVEGDAANRYEAGMALRRRTLGDAYVQKAVDNATDFTRPFQEFVTEYAWGAVWDRPNFPAQKRSLVTVAILAALNQHDELRLHVQSALRNGCRPEELQETLFHVALYAGLPAAVSGFRIAQQVLDEAGISLGSEH